jgi:hypothetical protein
MWHAWERKAKCIRFLVVNPEGKRPLGRPRRRREDETRIGLGRLAGVCSGSMWLITGACGGLL